MVKAADRAGVMMLTGQDSRVHWGKARAMRRPLEAVLCLSPVLALSLCSMTKLLQPDLLQAPQLEASAAFQAAHPVGEHLAATPLSCSKLSASIVSARSSAAKPHEPLPGRGARHPQRTAGAREGKLPVAQKRTGAVRS